jgi:SMC domain protein
MENIFKELKGKIEEYEKFLKANTIEVDGSEASKIENEIKTMKSKIEELTNSMEGKSKIEKMKITLNISSLESEITLKEMDLDEKKEKSKNEYENKVKSHNSKLDDVKNDIEAFIVDSENKIEKSIKNSEGSVLLGNDLEEVKGYYENIVKVELTSLNTIKSEENKINNELNRIKQKINEYYDRANDYQSEGTSWALKKPTTFFGNFDEDKADDYRDNMRYCNNEAQKYRKMAFDEEDKAKPFQKELDKLKIKKEAIENKLKVIDEMVDEMIKEVIKEEIKKREIVIPNFVPVTKYFNAPDEVEK